MKVIPLIFAVVALTGCRATDDSPKSGGKLVLAYNVLVDPAADTYDVYVMNLDGTESRNITDREGVDWVYAAVGDRLFFVSDRDTTHRALFLYEMDANGDNVRKIYPERLHDSWIGIRKDASEFVVTTNVFDVRSLVLIDRDGKELDVVLSTGAHLITDPSFSPDGRHIAFRSGESGVDEIWIMTEIGDSLRQLTHYPDSSAKLTDRFYHAGPPFWEPNHNVISYTSFQNDNYSIFVINPDGTGFRQLTPDGQEEGWHSWSPDGTLIAYDGANPEEQNYDIYLMNADGTDVRRLTTDPAFEQAAVFVRLPAE
jgi:TolB protein